MLSAYGDDSSDEKRERIFVVAAVMGYQEEWDKLEIKWLTRTNGKIFHATDCESGYGDYRYIPKQERHNEYRDLISILVNSSLYGFGIAIDIDGYKNYHPDAMDDAPYFICFVRVISKLVKEAKKLNKRVKFTFDINHKVQYNAAFLYENYIVKRDEYKEYSQYMDDELGFATSKSVGIQVADLYTREFMKHFNNLFYDPNRPIRKSMQALIETNRFGGNYLHRDYFKDFKRKYESLGNELIDDYQKWLIAHRCIDNIENKTRYLIYTEIKDI